MSDTKRILVVDSLEGSELITPIIKKFGNQLCGVAESGETAMKLIRDTKPDLVFINVALKGEVNCTGLACHINQHEKIPFIYMAEHAGKEDVDEVIHTRPSMFLLKPFVESEINQAINIATRKQAG